MGVEEGVRLDGCGGTLGKYSQGLFLKVVGDVSKSHGEGNGYRVRRGGGGGGRCWMVPTSI